MKRETSTRIAEWKKAFSGKKPATAGGDSPQRRKGQKQDGASLALIRRQPATFRLSRLESPEDFERMLFVVKARAKASDRPFKTVLHVEQTRAGSRLVATDGLRLHVAEIPTKIKSGDYRPQVARDCIALGEPLAGIEFPDWSKAVPKNAVQSGVVSLEKAGKGSAARKAAELSLAANALSAKTGMVVSFQHIAELPKTAWTVYREPVSGNVMVRQQGGEDRAFAVFVPVGKAAA